MEFSINQLSVEVLKSIFDAAFIETEMDEGGELFVKDDLCVWVEGNPDQDCFSYTSVFGIENDHKRVKLLDACNGFNTRFYGLKAFITENNDTLVFNYTVLMKGGGTIAGKEIVRLLRFFQEAVSAALNDEIFEFLEP
jgi:hypothetical protein